MADAFYTEALNDFAKGDLDFLVDAFKVYLLNNSYIFNAAHTQYSDFSAAVIDSGLLLSPAVANGGQCDAADTTIPAVVAGNTITALLIGKDSGLGVVRPVCYLDSYTGLPAVTNDNDILIQWPSYIFEV